MSQTTPKSFSLPVLALFTSFCSFAQNTPGWTVKKPFASEVFIENRGQFDLPDGQNVQNIQYAVKNGSLNVYFTPSGMNYHMINIEPNFKDKEEAHEATESAEKELRRTGKINSADYKQYYTDKSAYVKIEWENANPDAAILVSEKVPDHYSYSKEENGNLLPIIAQAYKKLTYKNIYPNIDIEFSFRENSDDLGVKYNMVVHPGGDISKVKMKYSGMRNISMNKNGDVVAEIPDGNITDRSPALSYVGNTSHTVKANFVLNGQTVSFHIPSYDKNQTLVIDPFIAVWNTNPGFTTNNMGYTVRVDYLRNVYVGGGGTLVGGAGPPNRTYQVKKFSPAGALLWTYTSVSIFNGWYGDLTVLRAGTVFLGFGLGSGTIYKLSNSNGTLITSKGFGNNEPWRFSYNQALNNNILYYGSGSENGVHLRQTDTNLAASTSFGPWSSNNNNEDVAYLAQDKAGAFVYSTIANKAGSTAAGRPSMVKVAAGALGTAVWQSADPSPLEELGQMSFANGGAAPPGGFTKGWTTGVNGMVVCGNRVYTYDGRIVRGWNTANGAINDSAITGGVFDKHGGIDADNCCRVYVGHSNAIRRYTSSLSFDVSIPAAGEVYDLVLDPQNQDILYVTGNGFVQRIDSMGICPNPTVTAAGGNVCPGGCTSVTASPTGGTSPYTYSWNPGGGNTQTINVCPTGTTVYTVTITDAGGSTATSTATVTISSSPTATVTSPSTICPGNSTTLTAGGGGTYSWNTGATASSITVSPSSNTSYSVWVTNGSGCKDSVVTTVSIGAAVTPSVTPAVICSGGTATVTASGGTTYSWNTGALTSSISVSPSATTSYTVVVTAGSCTATAVATVTVSTGITAGINGNTSICAGASATLTASGGSTFSWSTGQTSNSIVVTPSSPSTYSLWAYSGTCKDSTSINVTVNPIPTPSVSSSTICAGQTTTLTASGGNSYVWSNGSSSNSISVNPTSTTSYTVTVSSAAGCTASTTTTVTVAPPFTPSSTSAVICPGDVATISASGGTAYSWSTGALTSSTTVSPSSTTSYTVTVTSNGCTATAVSTVSVTASIQANISGNTSVCAGSSTTLTASGGTSFSWNGGSTSPTLVISPSSNSTYSVWVYSGSCKDSTSVNVTVNPLPTPTASSATICAGQSANLTATGGGTYSWSNGGASASISVTPASSSSYTVTVTSSAGCSATAVGNVTVNPLPAPSITGATTICRGDGATLNANGGFSYAWSTGSNSASIAISPSSTTTYSLTVTNSFGCTASTSAQVVVASPPNPAITGIKTICSGQSTVLTASGGGNYTWSTSEFTPSITVAPSASTSYSVLVSIGSCTATATYSVTVTPTPLATAQNNVVINYGDNTTLLATGSGSYSWVPSTGLSCSNCSSPVASPIVTTDYCVYVTSGGCTDSACVTVTVEYNCDAVYLPNAFSPNSDAENDILYVYGNCITEMKLIIYNRWGEKVYEGTDPKQGWDGYYRGKLEDPAVFAFYLEYTLITGTSGTKHGNISLVR